MLFWKWFIYSLTMHICLPIILNEQPSGKDFIKKIIVLLASAILLPLIDPLRSITNIISPLVIIWSSGICGTNDSIAVSISPVLVALSIHILGLMVVVVSISKLSVPDVDSNLLQLIVAVLFTIFTCDLEVDFASETCNIWEGIVMVALAETLILCLSTNIRVKQVTELTKERRTRRI